MPEALVIPHTEDLTDRSMLVWRINQGAVYPEYATHQEIIAAPSAGLETLQGQVDTLEGEFDTHEAEGSIHFVHLDYTEALATEGAWTLYNSGVYGTVRIHRCFHTAILTGVVLGGAQGSTIVTLPFDVRPLRTQLLPTVQNVGGTLLPATVTIYPGGAVQSNVPAGMAWLSLCVSFTLL